MKELTRNKLLAAWQYCDDEDKSTEFMIQFMMDNAKVDMDCVVNFIEKTTDEERVEWLKNIKAEAAIKNTETK
jgi:mannitol/fructose-specific phosphotransferase system IIA component (Ntr-type)